MRDPSTWSRRVGHNWTGYHHIVTKQASDRAP